MKYEANIDLELAGIANFGTFQYLNAKKYAVNVACKAMRENEKPYASISGGKDSLAMLAIVSEASRITGVDFTAWAHVSDASFPETIETIKEACEILDCKLIIDECPFSAFDVIGKQSIQRFGKSGYFFKAIKDFVVDGRYDLNFTGVRASESKRRREAFKYNGHTFKTKVPSPITRCDCIAHFKIEDVAACLYEYKLPIHPIYKKRQLENMPVRLGYITSLDLMDKDTLGFLRRNYYKEYQKLIKAYPEALNFKK